MFILTIAIIVLMAAVRALLSALLYCLLVLLMCILCTFSYERINDDDDDLWPHHPQFTKWRTSSSSSSRALLDAGKTENAAKYNYEVGLIYT